MADNSVAESHRRNRTRSAAASEGMAGGLLLVILAAFGGWHNWSNYLVVPLAVIGVGVLATQAKVISHVGYWGVYNPRIEP